MFIFLNLFTYQFGETAVMMANSLGHPDIVQYLIKRARAKSVVDFEVGKKVFLSKIHIVRILFYI